MKDIYLVYAEAVSTKTSINSDVVEIDAVIFVAENSQERARILARSALMNYGYRLTKVVENFVPTPSAVSNLEPESIAQYLEAIDQGYGVVIFAHAPDSDHYFGIHSLNSPNLYVTRKH